jgi:hypothetical protein
MRTRTSSLITRLLWLFAAVMVLFLGGAFYADLQLLQAFAFGAFAAGFLASVVWPRSTQSALLVQGARRFDRTLFLQRNDPLLI